MSSTPVLSLPYFRRALALVFFLAALSAAQDKRLTVFGPQGSFVVPVVDREGKEYVSLIEVLIPLGDTSAKPDRKKWRLRFLATESEFKAGSNKGKVGGKNLDLSAPFLLDGDTGLVPVHALAPVLQRLLPMPFDFRESARRLIVGPPTTFSAELNSQSQLVLHFSAPVNPSVATEPGRLRLDFTREPVVSTAATQNFNNHLISSASFGENNGAAELSVSGTAPLMASFSDNGRTVTISAVPQPKAAPRVAQAPSLPPMPPPAPAPGQPPSAPQPARPRFVVVIDPAHGGGDRGALFAANVAEKDLALTWARRLDAALEKNGVSAILLREGDTTLTPDQRAVAANAGRASVFLSVHVDDSNAGVRLYTARLADVGARSGAMLPWDSAQAAFLEASRALAGSLAAELTKRNVPHGAATALLRPLNNIAAPALAIEVGPVGGNLNTLSATEYQQLVCGAIAQGIAAARVSIAAAPAPRPAIQPSSPWKTPVPAQTGLRGAQEASVRP